MCICVCVMCVCFGALVKYRVSKEGERERKREFWDVHFCALHGRVNNQHTTHLHIYIYIYICIYICYLHLVYTHFAHLVFGYIYYFFFNTHQQQQTFVMNVYHLWFLPWLVLNVSSMKIFVPPWNN